MAFFSWEHEVYNRWTLVLDNPFVDLLGTYQQQIPETDGFPSLQYPGCGLCLCPGGADRRLAESLQEQGFRGKLQFFRGKMNENDDTVTCLNLGYSRGLFETTPYDSIWPWGMQPI